MCRSPLKGNRPFLYSDILVRVNIKIVVLGMLEVMCDYAVS